MRVRVCAVCLLKAFVGWTRLVIGHIHNAQHTQRSFKVNQREKVLFPLFESAFLVRTAHAQFIITLNC